MTNTRLKHKETTMFNKTQMVLSVAIVLGTASAALADTASRYGRFGFESAATARAMVHSSGTRHSSNPAFDVFDSSGRYIGSDPDPFIRSQLARDPAGGD